MATFMRACGPGPWYLIRERMKQVVATPRPAFCDVVCSATDALQNREPVT